MMIYVNPYMVTRQLQSLLLNGTETIFLPFESPDNHSSIAIRGKLLANFKLMLYINIQVPPARL